MLKCRDQRGFDTLVVYTLTNECWTFIIACLSYVNAKTFRLGSTIARLKLKGIDGEFFTVVEHVV